jgi:hypothetical protein
MPLVELVDFRSINIGDTILSAVANNPYTVINVTQTCIVVDSGKRVFALFRDKSYIVRSKSATLYFGITND